jgi:hypothetical protein
MEGPRKQTNFILELNRKVQKNRGKEETQTQGTNFLLIIPLSFSVSFDPSMLS